MKILFIAGQAIRSNSSVTMMNLAYISGLVEAGNYIKIITSSLPENHVAKDDGFNISKEVDIDEYSISASFNALSNKKTKPNNKVETTIKNLLRKLYYSYSIYDSQKAWVNNAEKVTDNEYYDLIISSSDPKHSHLFAKSLIDQGRIKYGKWIQLWGDPMYLDITRKNNLLKNRLYKEEEFLIKHADKVIYVSPFTAKQQKEIFPKYKDKIDYVLIPYFSQDETKPNTIVGKEMVFGYFGDYNSNIRNLAPMYEAALDSEMNLIIRGNSDKQLLSKKNIDVKGRVPIKELEELEKKTDIFIHLCNLKGSQIPAKVYYYSGTKKPILFILDGNSKEIKKFYSSFGRYFFCENNKEDILNAIEIIRNGYYLDREITVPEELSPMNIAKDLISKL